MRPWWLTLALSLSLPLPLAGLPAAAPAQERSTTADVIALTVCVIDADLRLAALAQLARGAAREAAIEAIGAQMPDPVYRAQAERRVDEVYRARPPAPRPYVAERLQQCASKAAVRVNAAAADGCYQLTRFANDFFAARAQQVPLEKTVASLRELAAAQGFGPEAETRLARLAASVYGTTVAPPEFRAGLFFHCVLPGRGLR
ncbi:MAG: hypothetical protein ING40_07970 [Burkholderiales bacterium]|jgi:hypothetical protein|nr:hypothetical protein [Burkholderiales bacterium]MCA3228952.1 hypothetical protein [Burkholderiales bacterium]